MPTHKQLAIMKNMLVEAVRSSELVQGGYSVAQVEAWLATASHEGWEIDNLFELSLPTPQGMARDRIPMANVLAQRFLDWQCNGRGNRRAYPSQQTVIRQLIERHQL